MSWYKTTYEVVVDPWGNTEEVPIYAYSNDTVGHIMVYDQHGKFILSFDDTSSNNITHAIERLWRPSMCESVDTAWVDEANDIPEYLWKKLNK